MADTYLDLIKQQLPDRPLRNARMLPVTGQFNTVVCIDERWIFRFPKSEHVAADLARELEILPRLQGKLPLPIPDPLFSATDSDSGQVLFMGYAMLPGEPLLRERFSMLRQDADTVARIADDLALFLLTLHKISPADIGLARQADDARKSWIRYYDEVREKLYPHMRAEARRQVSRDFEAGLNDQNLWRFDSCLIHGDFGTGNILYDFHEGCISGIIDFSFCGIGDPAQDLGALLASYGEDFVEQVLLRYPALRANLPRARFYCSKYALLQALFALRDNDPAEFEDGIADYR